MTKVWAIGICGLLTQAACSGTLGPSDVPVGAEDGASAEAGTVGVPGVTGGTTDSPTASGGVGSGPGTGPGGEPTALPPSARLRRLSLSQYQLSVQELLDLTPDISRLTPVPPLNGLQAVGASSIAVAEVDVEAFEAISNDLAAQVMEDGEARARLIGCDLTADGCVDSFIERFGKRAFRRPLQQDEADRYRALYERASGLLGGDGAHAMQFVISALLQSPSFLYRSELGEPTGQGGVRGLTRFELASRLSFLLWNGPPDAALLARAEDGSLADPQVLQAEAERMMDSPRFAVGMEALFRDYLRLDDVESLAKLTSEFPQMTSTLGPAMVQETLLTINAALVDGDEDFRTLFTGQRTFLNGELASLYGIDAPGAGENFVAVTWADAQQRAGLLSQGAFLAGRSHPDRTSPTQRGKYIREHLLCQALPPPPPGVSTTLPDTADAVTMRERLTRHALDPACAGCHSVMDPLGLALEHFDGLGVYRSTDHGQALDVSGTLDGATFDGAAGLGDAVSQHRNLPSCFVRTVMRVSRGQLEDSSEEPVVEGITDRFSERGYQLRGLLLAWVTHPSFSTVGDLP